MMPQNTTLHRQNWRNIDLV